MEYIEHTDHIFTVKSILSDSFCNELIQMSEEEGYVDAPITTAMGPVMAKNIRNNMRVIYDDYELADQMWEIIKDYVPSSHNGHEVVGLNERFRFYRYDPGQRFDWHYDGAYRRPNGERSYYTLIFYLNDEFTGGTTEFEDAIITPEKGDALIFWHYQRHIGADVLTGRKYVIRTDIMYGG